jgi:hypothetical protein
MERLQGAALRMQDDGPGDEDDETEDDYDDEGEEGDAGEDEDDDGEEPWQTRALARALA